MKLLVNEVFEIDGRATRVLHISGRLIYLYYLDASTKEFPFSMLDSELEELCFREKAIRVEDPYQYQDKNIKEKSLKIAEKRMERIRELVESPEILVASSRFKLIKSASQTTGAGENNLYKWIKQYWQRGQSLVALLPNFHFCGAKGTERKDTSNMGRPRKNIPGRAPAMTDELRRIFRTVTDDYLLTPQSLGLEGATRKTQNIYKNLYPDTIEENLPTQSQLRNFLRREVTLAQKAKQLSTKPNYDNNVAPLRGTAAENTMGPGSRFEIDATIADIYLVSDKDASMIIGRPTLYLIVDTFSRLIVGFHIGMENASYVTAMRAVSSIFMDWQAYANELGLVVPNELFHQAGIPDTLLADRGELLGHQTEMLSKINSTIIEFAPPFRAISKAVVERHFRSIQATFKKFVPGVVEGVIVKKRGGKDYRLDATLNLTEFKRLIFGSILLYNNFHTVKKYDRSEDMPNDLPAIPMRLWNWGLQNRTGRLRQPNSKLFNLALLPREKATFDDRGVKIFGVYYTCQELFRSGWLHRHSVVNRPKNLEAAYDPADANKIYLFVEPREGEIWECKLAPHSREFSDSSFWEVLLIMEERRKLDAKNKLVENKHRRDLESWLEDTTTEAIERRKKAQTGSNRSQIRQIIPNKQKEIIEARKERLYDEEGNSRDISADLYLLENAEFDDDLDVPDSVDFLFDDED